MFLRQPTPFYLIKIFYRVHTLNKLYSNRIWFQCDHWILFFLFVFFNINVILSLHTLRIFIIPCLLFIFTLTRKYLIDVQTTIFLKVFVSVWSFFYVLPVSASTYNFTILVILIFSHIHVFMAFLSSFWSCRSLFWLNCICFWLFLFFYSL